MLFSLCVSIIIVGEVGVLAVIHYLFHMLHKNTSSIDSSSDSAVLTDLSTAPPSFHISKFSKQTASKLAKSFSWNKYIACLMSALLFCYTQVAVTSFQYLFCVDVGSSRVVFTSPTIDCHSAQYRAYLPAPILAIVFNIIGFPLAVVTLLRVHKETLFVSVVANADIKASSLSGFFLRWSPLFQMFHPRAFYWQSLLLLRRSMYVLASVLLVQQPLIRFMAFGFLNFGSLLLHLLVQPFDSERLNHFEAVSYSLLVSLSMILGGTTRPYSDATQAVLLILIVLPTVALVGYIVWCEWQQFRARSSPSEEARSDNKRDVEMVSTTVDGIEIAAAHEQADSTSIVAQPSMMLESSDPRSDSAEI